MELHLWVCGGKAYVGLRQIRSFCNFFVVQPNFDEGPLDSGRLTEVTFASLATLCRGYRTSPIPTGHGVFETEAAFAALHEEASQELQNKGGPPLAIHIPCRIYPQLIDWALRAGLKLVRYALLT